MSRFITRVKNKSESALWHARKEYYQWRRGTVRPQALVLIIGCQRSGTTLLTHILEKDWNTKVYPEHSPLSSQDALDKLRLNPLPEVAREVEGQRFPIVVLKPLVETQNALKLLSFFDRARGVWLYRHYKDVAASNLRRFGPANGIKNLRYIANNVQDNWRAEALPAHLRRLIATHFSETMDPFDAAALFWYVRNSFYFDLGLNQHPDVYPLQYETLVRHPEGTMKELYSFIRQTYPGPRIVEDVFTSSVGKGQEVTLSAEVEALCEQMWQAYQTDDNYFTTAALASQDTSLSR